MTFKQRESKRGIYSVGHGGMLAVICSFVQAGFIHRCFPLNRFTRITAMLRAHISFLRSAAYSDLCFFCLVQWFWCIQIRGVLYLNTIVFTLILLHFTRLFTLLHLNTRRFLVCFFCRKLIKMWTRCLIKTQPFKGRIRLLFISNPCTCCIYTWSCIWPSLNTLRLFALHVGQTVSFYFSGFLVENEMQRGSNFVNR